MQETALRCSNVLLAGFAAVCELHDEPRHTAASPSTLPLVKTAPTASQNPRDTHDTPAREPEPAGSGMVCAVQVDPSQP